jgi:hypothetical protein
VIEGATDTSATNPPHIPTQWRLKNKPVRNISPNSIRNVLLKTSALQVPL